MAGFRLDALGLIIGLAAACALASYFLLSERGLDGRDPRRRLAASAGPPFEGTVSVLSTVEVLVAAGIAWVLLGESLAPAQLAGGAVLLAGIVVVQLRRAAPITPPEPRSPRADRRSSPRAG